jgi:hypothetical protein
MKATSRPITMRKPSNLSDLLHSQLNSYALAASAAGVSLLALTQPAEGKIIYTRDNRELVNQHVVYLDLNHDGTSDFYFYGSYSAKTSSGIANLGVFPEPLQNNSIWAEESRGHACAAPLTYGQHIEAGQPFKQQVLLMFARTWGPTSSKNRCARGEKAGTHYLGLLFHIKGKIHYGWARIDVANYPFIGATYLTGYAYETVANKGIIAGKTKGPDVVTVEPGSLGALASGASRFRNGM